MRSLAVSVGLFAMLSVSVAKDELHVSDLVKQHMNSIGTEQARAAVRTRVAEGTLQFKLLSSGNPTQDGKQVFISEGDKLVTLLKLQSPSYHGERFVSDGRKTFIASMTPGVYSELGRFVQVHDEILTEGLWGGTLSTGWALARVDKRRATLRYQGLKKVDGRDLYRVDYITSKSTTLEIQLYFEPDTFRHVVSIYSLTIAPQIAMTEQENAQQKSTEYRLEERFSDFKQMDGLMLPRVWTIRFTSNVPFGNHPTIGYAQSSESVFTVTVNSVSHNVQLDPKNFEVK